MDILAARKKAAEQARSRPDNVMGEQPAAPVVAPAIPEQRRPESACAPHEPASGDSAEVVVIEPAGGSAPAVAASDGIPVELPVDQTALSVEELELLCFEAAGESYAVPIEDVREVLKNRPHTLVPNAPAHILGVMSLRGVMLPVIGLALRLGLGRGAESEKARIVVIKVGDEDVGLQVDRVTGVLSISSAAIRPAPEHVEQGSEFLQGIVRQDEKLYILLDLQAVVNG